MSTLTIRQLDESVVQALKSRAKSNGRSMEAEVREILEASVRSNDWWGRWVEATAELRGDPLPLPARSTPRDGDPL